MDLAEKLLKIPERENAGARSSNRFSFQQVWAFDYMLKIIDADSDFFLFMEFHDDIIVINRLEREEYVEFFQGLILGATALSSIPYLTDNLGLPYELAWSCVIIEVFMYMDG